MPQSNKLASGWELSFSALTRLYKVFRKYEEDRDLDGQGPKISETLRSLHALQNKAFELEKHLNDLSSVALAALYEKSQDHQFGNFEEYSRRKNHEFSDNLNQLGRLAGLAAVELNQKFDPLYGEGGQGTGSALGRLRETRVSPISLNNLIYFRSPNEKLGFLLLCVLHSANHPLTAIGSRGARTGLNKLLNDIWEYYQRWILKKGGVTMAKSPNWDLALQHRELIWEHCKQIRESETVWNETLFGTGAKKDVFQRATSHFRGS